MNLETLENLTLPMIMVIGVVNVLTMWKPGLDNKSKWAISFLTAFLVTFVPAELGNVLLNHIKTALEVAFTASGLYKLTQKVGGQ